MTEHALPLRYGLNPYQTPARSFLQDRSLPFRVLNGSLGYINLLDALNSWQMVKELKQATGWPAAASFKHVSPAGAAVSIPLTDALQKAYGVEDLELSPLATAYARARGADRLCSFGDWVALSDRVDVSTARLLKAEVSDGVVAPSYEPEALALLREKKKGAYIVMEIDQEFKPDPVERRDVFGVTLEQKRNELVIGSDSLGRIVTRRQELSDPAKRDLLIAMIGLKYTQSNSVCVVMDGQVIGMGAGQQSRVHCTRLAQSKAVVWFLRQHPVVLGLSFRSGVGRPDRDNARDQFLREDLTQAEMKALEEKVEGLPHQLGHEEKRLWLSNLKGVSLGSDGFIPFRDTIDCAAGIGVEYVAQPGGSLRDGEVIEACDQYGMVMAFTGIRLFHH